MAYILVVDDDRQLRRNLSEFLEEFGHRVVAAGDGADGLRRIQQECPDGVVLDLQMPLMDGWSLLRRCRETSELSDLPVIVMSATLGASATLVGLNVSCCLTKPFELDDLVAALEAIGIVGQVPAHLCAYCGAEPATQQVRVFTRARPDDSWLLCHRCWKFMQVGFDANRPDESMEQRLAATIAVHAMDVRNWITAGLKLTGRPARRGWH
jgi:CheY-like chemotaxis protein